MGRDLRNDPAFGKKLERCIKVQDIPEKVFCATDYHLDWIEAALHLLEIEPSGSPPRISVPSGNFNHSQQDIDLLITLAEKRNPETTHVLLMEAKAYTSWSSTQLD